VDDVRAFLDASKAFFEALAAVGWGALGLAVFFQVVRLLLRVRGWQNILRAAYPDARIPYVPIFGSYIAGVGVNAIVPARGGDVVKLYLAKQRIKDASYPTLASTLLVETLFDFVVATVLVVSAIKLGLLPGVPELPSLPAFDWTFVVTHPKLAILLASMLLAGVLLFVVWASRQVVAFREKVSLGFAALEDRRAFLIQVVSWQALSWLARIGSTFFFLRAFHVDATVKTTIAVLVVQGLSTVLPFTPGGAGTQQAVLVFALSGAASRSTILAFAFGQQLVVTFVNAGLGFGAIAVMLRTLRWRGHVRSAEEGPEDAETASPDGGPADVPSRSALPR
jgi:glycosyltransferase 2 family protein